jgi:hypothetical protein
MECDAGIKMAIKVVHTYQVFYTTMIWDDDSTISGNCKWSYKVYYYKIYCLNGQKKQWRKKRKPWMPSITHQQTGFSIGTLPPRLSQADCL